jgi:hypothetical protein
MGWLIIYLMRWFINYLKQFSVELYGLLIVRILNILEQT